MTRINGWLMGAVIVLGGIAMVLALASAAERQERVAFDKLPKRVTETIRKRAGGRRIRTVTKETENGQTVYEATWLARVRFEVEVAPDGKLLEQEQQLVEREHEVTVPLSQVPAAVRETILDEAGDRDVEEVEKELSNGQVTYEAEWKVEGGEVEIKVAPDGKLLQKEREEDDEDDDESERHDDD